MKTSKQDLRGPRTAQDLQQMYGLGSGYVDSIVESGTLNGWYYEKWESGKAECWKRATHKNVQIDKVFGSLYATSDKFKEKFPILFAEIPVCNVSIESNYSCFICPGGTSATIAMTQDIQICRPTSVTADYLIFHWHAIGRWK